MNGNKNLAKIICIRKIEKRTSIIDYAKNYPEYEKKKFAYFLALPLMDAMALWAMFKKGICKIFKKNLKTNSYFFDGVGSLLKEIKENAAKWRALDIIYNHIQYIEEKNFKGLEKLVTKFFLGMRNAQAVRNRKKLVALEISKLIAKIYNETKTPVKICSIASGSAQAVLEGVKIHNIPVKIFLLDINKDALKHSVKLAKKEGLESCLVTIRGSATNLEKLFLTIKPDIVEMVGFLDYRPNEKATLLLNRIYKNMENGSYFLTGNIIPNREKLFLKAIINWKMIYRKPKKLKEVIEKAGFRRNNILVESLGIHSIAVCKK